ncbi:MAG: 30S ribosomal protein S4, partial [Brachybacterium tyrofermentans]
KKEPGLTGESMVELLEMRLDALVLRSGFARTTLQARQAVVHRHVLVDGKIVDRPSFRVKPGQTIQIKPKSQAMESFQIAAEGGNSDVLASVPSYLSVELSELKSQLVARPKRAEVPVTCEVQMVVEYYAR